MGCGFGALACGSCGGKHGLFEVVARNREKGVSAVSTTHIATCCTYKFRILRAETVRRRVWMRTALDALIGRPYPGPFRG